MTEEVFLPAQRATHYHTDADCPALKQTAAIRVLPKPELPEETTPCEWCADPSPLIHDPGYWRKRLPKLGQNRGTP